MKDRSESEEWDRGEEAERITGNLFPVQGKETGEGGAETYISAKKKENNVLKAANL